ncbi:MAG: hypothetical protein UY52_C0011G0065 [Parcubacteria group bacterium GW2011_GWC2_49_9]|nr:MAG: hypothetical protein UY52_C0011G0065 [Parcubacteria group bacterium GW2011_GWC2_49_9]
MLIIDVFRVDKIPENTYYALSKTRESKRSITKIGGAL